MPYPESPKRRELRAALRAVTIHVASLDAHAFDSSEGEAHHIKILPMDLDGKAAPSPTFFTPYPASLLLNPDDDYDRRLTPGYREFDPSLPPNHRKPIDCARNMVEYFVRYFGACSKLRQDVVLYGPWSDVR